MPHWLTKQANVSPHVIAIETPKGDIVTFKELKNASEQYAKQLMYLGVKKGDHVGVLAHNSIEMIVTIHALSYIGAVGVFLNIRLTASELIFQLEDADVSCVLTNLDDDQRLEELSAIVPIYSFIHISKQPLAEVPMQEEINLEDVFTIMYTSGTTGSPKGVVHTYGNHWWSAIGSALNLSLDPQDKWASPLPLFHVGGFSVCMKSVIYGMPMLLFEKFSAKSMHEAIMHKQVTIVSVVTMMVQQLLKELGDDIYPSTLRCLLLGGGAAPKSLLLQAKEKNLPITQSYGLTETTSQFATLQAAVALDKIGSSGKALFPGQLKIVDQDAQGVGEIVVKGPMVTKGYYKKEDINAREIVDEWLHTGDIGHVDKEGFLYVYERRSDLIISGGENIYPSEIEEEIRKLEGVEEVVVVGVKDETWGSTPAACIVQTGKELTKEKIIEDITPLLASYKIPKYIYFIEEVPRNATNKIMRHVLQDRIEKGEMT